jgi:hypothetical protein
MILCLYYPHSEPRYLGVTSATAQPAPTPFAHIWDALLRLAQHAADYVNTIRTTPREEHRARFTAPINAFCWLVALTHTLAGDRSWLDATIRAPSANPGAQSRTRPGRFRPSTEQDCERAQRRRIRIAFNTQPLGVIAERIAHRLGLRPTDPLWPHDLAAITKTPAQLVAPPEPAAPQSRPANPPAANHPTPNPPTAAPPRAKSAPD